MTPNGPNMDPKMIKNRVGGERGGEEERKEGEAESRGRRREGHRASSPNKKERL